MRQLKLPFPTRVEKRMERVLNLARRSGKLRIENDEVSVLLGTAYRRSDRWATSKKSDHTEETD